MMFKSLMINEQNCASVEQTKKDPMAKINALGSSGNV